jgi:hypothetical protein
MRKVKLFAVSAAVLAIGVGVWAASPTKARAPSLSQGINPHHHNDERQGTACHRVCRLHVRISLNSPM